MGHTKTICCTVKRDRPQAWESVRRERIALKESLEKYLAEDACVKHVPRVTRGLDSHVDTLADGYVALIHEEVVGHKDRVASVRSMRAFALVFAEMWRLPASQMSSLYDRTDEFSIENPSAKSASLVRLDSLARLSTKHEKAVVSSPEQAEALAVAKVFADAYIKASAEFHAALQGDNLFVVKHHGTLLGDLLEQMLQLSLRPTPRSVYDFTEFDLPDDHPQALRRDG